MGKHIKASDRVGTILNGFKVLDWKRENCRTYFYVECPYCKNHVWKRADYIVNPRNMVSCGCYNQTHNQKKPEDITSEVFGRLKAIKPTPRRDSNGSIFWLCECECGNITYASVTSLKTGGVHSCGCLRKESSVKNYKRAGKNIKDKYCIDGTNVNNLTAKIPKNNTSGIKGVGWDKSRRKWTANITFKGTVYYLGRFDNKEMAVEARLEAEKKLYEPFLEWYSESIGNNE